MNELLLSLGFLAVAVGIALVIAGMIFSLFGGRRRRELSRTKTAGVVLIGPFPIIFGDKDLIKYSLVLLVIFIALSLVLLLGLLRLT